MVFILCADDVDLLTIFGLRPYASARSCLFYLHLLFSFCLVFLSLVLSISTFVCVYPCQRLDPVGLSPHFLSLLSGRPGGGDRFPTRRSELAIDLASGNLRSISRHTGGC